MGAYKLFQYKRPPITEAVIEIRFAKPLADETVQKLKTKFESRYPAIEPIREFGIAVDISEIQATVNEERVGYKLSSEDRADIVIVTNVNFTASRLAPYKGWEKFKEVALENWKIWKKIAGYQKIFRLGVRYINRIDIKSGDDGLVKLEDYLHVYPEAPDPPDFPAFGQFTLKIAGNLGKDECQLAIQSGIVRSPLVNTMSILLDIDISRVKDVPQKDDDVWAQFDRIRDYKNEVFETCITDRTRGLFDQ